MDQLEEIKTKIDIVNLISEYLPLKKAGRNFKALCPFHGEKTPSFMISPERQIWHCFGCQKGGDIFGFLMQMENMEFPEALETLAKRAGVKLVRSFEISEQAKNKEKIYKINHLASEYYHYLLVSHPSGQEALDYVLGRGVKKKTLETFSLGWAPKNWDNLIKFLTKKGFSLPEMEAAGLVIKDKNYYDRFRGRLMFTLRDHRGNIVGFAGRTLDPKAQEAKYINTPETAVYIKGNILYGLDITKEAIKKEDRAIIVEGEFDLISSFQAGVANVVAIKGSALTVNQVNLLKRFTQNLDLALDMDLAGDAAARRGIEVADAAGLTINVVSLPQGKDPDECARANPGLWQKAVKEAIPVFDHLLAKALERFDKSTADGKRKIGDEVIPTLARIANPIVQSHYLSKLAGLLGVSEEVIIETAKKLTKKEELGKTGSVSPTSTQGQALSRQQLLEEQFLALILQSPDLTEILKEEKWTIKPEIFSSLAIRKIFEKLYLYLAKQPQFTIKDFVKILPQELVPTLDQAYLLDLASILDDKKLFERELEKTAAEIKKIDCKNKLLAFSAKMKEVNKEELESLTQEYRQIAAELKKYQKT